MHPPVPFLRRPSSRLLAAGAVVCVLLAVAGTASYVILTGTARQFREANPPGGQGEPSPAGTPTSSAALVPRRLDGIPVEVSVAAYRPWAFMIDNQIDARPSVGVEAASVVVEAPVEGGITRLLAIFDPSTTSTLKIGPVRSARPYYVDWAASWNAVYGHVGGSPDALDKLAAIPAETLLDANEMTRATAGYWRDPQRVSPHQVLTTPERFAAFLDGRASSTARFTAWRYTDAPVPTSTAAVSSVRIPYGGSYNARWDYDSARNAYRRVQAGRPLSAEPVYAANVAVLKTDGQVLDEKGRLRVRTTGGGQAVLYRDGKKIIGRWSRAAGETIRFVDTQGNDLELRAGKTWIQVTTDDRVFAGLDGATP